jgi:hypothetical protein
MAKPKRGRTITANNAPRVWTGDALLDRMLALAGFTGKELRHALGRTVEALDAVLPEKRTTSETLDKFGTVIGLTKIEEGGAPDHPVRLRAAENLFDWVGFKGKRERDNSDPTKITEIHVHLHAGGGPGTNGHGPRAALPGRGLSVHLDGHNGGPGA